MATQRRYSIEFKRQVVQEYQAGETLHGLGKRHGISRNLVRIWTAKAEASEFDDDLAAASILQEYDAGKRAICAAAQAFRRPCPDLASQRPLKDDMQCVVERLSPNMH